MQIDEGGVQTGSSLSDYISVGLDKVATQKAEQERQLIERRTRQMDVWFQGTIPLRAHLLELAKPLDELLTRLRVKELLEEAQTQFLQGGMLRKLEPQIYRSIVSQPDDPDFYRKFNLPESQARPNDHHRGNQPLYHRGVLIPLYSLLNPELDPDNFARANRDHMLSGVRMLVDSWDVRPDPNEEGYGWALELGEKPIISVYRQRQRSGRHETRRWLGPGGGDMWTVTGEGTSYWEKTDSKIRVYETRTMVVEGIKLVTGQHPYDLAYSYIGMYRHPDSGKMESRYLTPPKIFSSLETLKQLIANDIVREKTSSINR